jgi:hypothetical protein
VQDTNYSSRVSREFYTGRVPVIIVLEIFIEIIKRRISLDYFIDILSIRLIYLTCRTIDRHGAARIFFLNQYVKDHNSDFTPQRLRLLPFVWLSLSFPLLQ